MTFLPGAHRNAHRLKLTRNSCLVSKWHSAGAPDSAADALDRNGLSSVLTTKLHVARSLTAAAFPASADNASVTT